MNLPPDVPANRVCPVCDAPRAGILSWRRTGNGDAFIINYRCRNCKNVSTFVRYDQPIEEAEA